jgi:predicted dehydrogenase
MIENSVTRRRFLQATGAAAVGGALGVNPLFAADGRAPRRKMRVALVGTGVRGVAMYGRDLLRGYSDHVDMVGVCDSNPGRLRVGHRYIGADCPAFVDLEEMLVATKPEWLIVTSWDWEHHNHILTGLRHGCHVICEKPITIDEAKAQVILDGQREYGREVIVTHNYRYAPNRARLKEMLMQGVIGDIRTVEFHWQITHDHLKRYMQRWHGQADRGGTLWVHKASHHFDLLNWWLDSDPVEVFAYGALERFGRNGPFRGRNCRSCDHTAACPYYWDITADEHLRSLYADNEHHDGYIRDNCVFRESIDIQDKHAAVVKYANGAVVNYSLTGESDYEGFWLAFNGTRGRIEGREGGTPHDPGYHEWVLQVRGRDPEVVRVDFQEGGHWGGDPILMDRLFKDPGAPDPLHQSAGTRDGIMAVLAGVAARQSIQVGSPVRIEGMTSLQPRPRRPRA